MVSCAPDNPSKYVCFSGWMRHPCAPKKWYHHNPYDCSYVRTSPVRFRISRKPRSCTSVYCTNTHTHTHHKHLQRIVNDIHSIYIYIYIYIYVIYIAIRAYALLPRLARIDTTTTISIRNGSEEFHLQYSCRIEPQPRKEVLLRRP